MAFSGHDRWYQSSSFPATAAATTLIRALDSTTAQTQINQIEGVWHQRLEHIELATMKKINRFDDEISQLRENRAYWRNLVQPEVETSSFAHNDCLVNLNRKPQYQNYFFPGPTITSIKEAVEPMITQIEIDHIRKGQTKFNSKLDEIINQLDKFVEGRKNKVEKSQQLTHKLEGQSDN
jgi:hypothetical protein